MSAPPEARLKHLDGLLEIDQGRSLLACTTRMFEILFRRPRERPAIEIVVRTALYTKASEPTSSRLSDYSLVKEHLQTSPATFVAFAVISPSGEAESYRSIRLCQSGVAKKIPTLRFPGSTRSLLREQDLSACTDQQLDSLHPSPRVL